MNGLMSIPRPVKYLFENFPLKVYDAVSKEDDAMMNRIQERKYAFNGPHAYQDSADNVFTLGVYNVYEEKSLGLVLATDPLCLFAQLALCKRNKISLPKQNGNDKRPRHSMAVLSAMAAPGESLPVLVEGRSKRFIRSCEDVMETLKCRYSENAVELVHIMLLDEVVYDYWIVQAVTELSNKEFWELYGLQTDTVLINNNPLVVDRVKLQLLKRNNFDIRNQEFSNMWQSPFKLYKHGSLNELIAPLFNSCKDTLINFEAMLKKDRKMLFSENNVELSFLDLKIASYIAPLTTVEFLAKSSLGKFVKENCPLLSQHYKNVLKRIS